MVFTATNEFARKVVVDPWPEGGVAVDVEADAAEREALARRFDVIEIGRFAGRGRVERAEGGREVRFFGALEAEVVQTCVVSLEPVTTTVVQPVERRYSVASEPSPAQAQDVVIDPEEVEIDQLEGPSIDLGEVLAEELGLALEPYPHAPDAYAMLPELGPDVSFGEPEADEPESPFAALRHLATPRAR